MLRQVSL